MTFRWDRKKTHLLIQLIELQPCLWDPNFPDYKDREKKSMHLKAIAEELGAMDEEITRKWHNLRCQFNAEVRKMKKYGNSRSSSWEFTDALRFLSQSHGSTEFSLDGNSTFDYKHQLLSQEDEPSQSEHFEHSIDPTSFLNKKIKLENMEEDTSGSGMGTLHHLLNATPDDNIVFGNYVAAELRQLSCETRRRKLKLIIQKAILATAEEDYLELANSTKPVPDASDFDPRPPGSPSSMLEVQFQETSNYEPD